MKRTITLVLTLVLLLGLMPVTAHAGGGGASLIWLEDFSGDLSDGWTVVDANNDGYSFGWNSEGYVQSGAIVGMGLLPPEPRAGEDYLISPAITLQGDEEVLHYDARTSTGAPDVLFDVFVCPSNGIPLREDLLSTLRNPNYHDVCYSWGSEIDWKSRTLDLTAYAGQTVYLVFRQRAQYDGCCLMLDNVSIYWNEPDDILDKVTALNVPEPRDYRRVADCLESDISFPEFANYQLIPGSLTYYHTVDEQSREYDGTFAQGEEYALSFEVMVKPGSTVNNIGIASVNGRHAFFRSLSNEVVRVDVYFERLSAPLKTVEVSVTPPLAGRIPVPEEGCIADPSKCILVDHAFVMQQEGSQTGEAPLEGEAFELNRTYRITALLAPVNGWDLTENTKVTINGRAAEQVGVNAGLPVYAVKIKVDRVLFRDVKPDLWYTGAVAYCYEHGLMAGTGDGYSFSPNMAFSRAMFVTVLAKIDGADTSAYTGSHFTDVKPGKWYSGAVEWAYQKNYAGGTGNGKFSPDAAVTRETLAVFLYNYTVKKFGSQENGAKADLSAYPDAKDVSSWAEEAMRWAVGAGLIGGKDVNNQIRLCPQNTATRSEVALIVEKYMAYLDSILR